MARYWRAVEMFSPSKVEDVAPRKGMRVVRSGEPLPWEEGSGLSVPSPEKAWQHTVYCGVFELAAVRDRLAEIFEDKGGENFDGRVRGDSALLAFTVNAAGMLLKDSITVSSCAWATGRSADPGPADSGWLDGFGVAEGRITEVLSGVGDGKVEVRGGHVLPGEESLLRVGGKLALTALADGATGGLASLVGESAGGLLPGIAGKAASAAAEQTVESLSEGAQEAYRERREADSDTTGEPAEEEPDGESAKSGPADQSTAGHHPNLGTRPVTCADLAGVLAWVAKELGVTEALNPRTARVKSFQVGRKRADEPSKQDFLNSFFGEDLASAASALDTRRGGPVLEHYLMPEAELQLDERRDVREEPVQVLYGVDPRRMPDGCWPATYPLALSQQFAVDEMWAQLRSRSGTFSVNGPPGTGKTTLLRDVVAAVVTERATRLAALRNPSDAFRGKSHTYSVDGREQEIRQLAEELTGFEMVVASANNGAVENITREIPALAALPKEWRDASYLRAPATSLAEEEPVWGAVAAALGKRENRSTFVSRFYWGKAKNGPSGARSSKTEQNASTSTAQGLRSYLADPKRRLERGGWGEAVARFRAAQREVQRLRAERAAVADDLYGLPVAQARAREAERGAEPARRRLAELDAELTAADERLDADERVAHQCRVAQREYEMARPGFLSALLSLGKSRRAWRAEAALRRDAVDTADQEVRAASRHRAALGREVSTLERTVEEAGAARATLVEQTRRVERARAAWGEHVPDPAEFAPEAGQEAEERRERSAPWSDPEFTAARAQLFVEALRLHETFLLAGGTPVRESLKTAMRVVDGSAPADLPVEARLAAWQWLFLTVPVVSTTFASFGRMFAGLGASSFGWLFIDEAGQAAPQQAVGALWRTSRAVVVGDPKQLEPVLVLPYTAQQRLRAHFGVAQTWVPTGTSVQQLADRLNTWGTTLPDDTTSEGELWVGAPLRVHRRCDDPMFSVSNAIAYDGMMVDGVREQRRGRFAPAQRSIWWNVASEEAEGHWVPAEGDALVEAVNRLRSQGLPKEELFVLSPFRAVAHEAGRRLRGLVDPRQVGTVHTAQGKESDVVVLVLGTHPDAAGTRNWASQQANLLNVAVSRAKRRLIVIGNREAWRGHRYFATLAHALQYYEG